MKNYSIMPLLDEKVIEICDDIQRQYEDGIATEALFSMTLTPEGDPVIDKAAILTEKFTLFRDELAKRGLKAGALVQASIGHGYKLPGGMPFTKAVGVIDGEERFVACPYDEGFRRYIKAAMKTIASAAPSSIMVDDDFRVHPSSTKGCACELHMNEVSKRYGKKITREEMVEKFEQQTDDGRRIMQIFYDVQVDGLLGAARAMREGIDEVDPTMQGSYCNCYDICGGAVDIAKILAGKGNPVIVRLNNGKYCSAGARGITNSIARAAIQREVMKNGVDIFLAETDTCPQNRYSTSAASLHTHFIFSILEGVSGAKHWITRLSAYEPRSGEAYRKKLCKYSKLYERLSSLVPEVKWFGAKIPLSDKPWIPMPPFSNYQYASENNSWAFCVLERLGLPLYYSSENGGAAFFDGRRDEFFSDAEIINMLEGTVFLAAETAMNLQNRGFGDYLGVTVEEFTDKDPLPNGENIFVNGNNCSMQMKLKKLIPSSEQTVAKSMLYTLPDGKTKAPICPGVTAYNNSLGGKVYVFSGTPNARFHYTEAFSFLNESRKLQLIELMRESGNLPVYYPDDAEVFIKAGYLGNKILLAFINIGLDNLDDITLVCENKVEKISMLCADGEFRAVDFTENDGIITVNASAEILDPKILIIESSRKLTIS